MVRASLRVAGKDLDLSGFVEGHYVKGRLIRMKITHAGCARWHASYGETANFGSFGQKPLDFGYRHMSFDDVAIHDGCMATLEFLRDFVTGFYCR